MHDIFLPVVDGTISLDLFLLHFDVLDIHACVVCKVTEGNLVYFFSEQLLLRLRSPQQTLHGLLSTHRRQREVGLVDL